MLAGKTITQVSAGGNHTCVVASGAAYCWGLNASGQLGEGTTADSNVPVAADTTGVLDGLTVAQISAANQSTCVVAGGAAYCWGYNSSGQLGNGTTTDSNVPVAVDTSDVIDGKTVYQISAGEAFTMVLGDGVTDEPTVPPVLPPTGSSTEVLVLGAALVLAGRLLTALRRRTAN